MNITGKILRVIGHGAIGVLVAMMLLTVADVFLRYVFSRPIIGTTEITEMLMACMVLAMAWCAVERRMVKVELVMGRFSPRVQAIVDSITYLAGMALTAILAWQAIVGSLEAIELDFETFMLGIPLAPFFWILALGFTMLGMAIFILLAERIAVAVKR
ncbi:TRAP transporter small permease [Chloroflexota bacterium]